MILKPHDFKDILKRVIIGVLIVLSLIYLKNSMLVAHAMASDYNISLNNNLMNYNTRFYTAGAANITLKMAESSNATLDYTIKPYGYIAICSAFGSYDNRYISALNPGSYITDLRVVNSTTGCTIPNNPDYKNTARVVYFSFRVKDSNVDWGASGPGGWFHPITFEWYQPTSNEFSLVSWGLSYDEYNFTDTIDPAINELSNVNSNLGLVRTAITDSMSQLGLQMQQAIGQLDGTMKDDSIDGTFQMQKMEELNNKTFSATSIADLVLLPVRLMEGMVDGLESSSCTPIDLGELYDTDLILPCITENQMRGWLGNVYNIFDYLFAFGIILGIRTTCIKIYKTIIFMREGSVD